MFFLPKRCPHCKKIVWPWKKRDHLWACRRRWMWMIAKGHMRELLDRPDYSKSGKNPPEEKHVQ